MGRLSKHDEDSLLADFEKLRQGYAHILLSPSLSIVDVLAYKNYYDLADKNVRFLGGQGKAFIRKF